MQTLWQDLRYGLRVLLKRPGFTVVAALTLALGIGANTAIFSVVNALFLSPFPYIDSDRWVYVWEKPMQPGGPRRLSASPPNIRDWNQQSQSFEAMAPFLLWNYNLSGEGDSERVQAAIISPEIFAALGTIPAGGRLLIPDDSKGSERLVVISYGLWQRRFGGDAQIHGRQINLNSVTHTVVGVAPQGFSFPPELPVDIWTAMPESMMQSDDRSGRGFQVAAKLKPGVSLKTAQTEMGLIAERLAKQYPQDKDYGVLLVSVREAMGENFRTPLLILSGALALVLILACINIANLQLTHLEARRKEIALRSALGASRWVIVRQLLTESLLLVLIAGGIGILLAPIGIYLLLSLVPSAATPNLRISIDHTVLLVSLTIVAITALVSGLIPAFKVSRVNLVRTLVTAGASSGSAGVSRRMRHLFLVAQLALALVPLVGAGLMIQSFIRLQRVNPGFSADRKLTLSISVPVAKYQEASKVAALAERIREEVRQIPGVQEAALVQALPFSPSTRWSQAISRRDPKGVNPDELPLVRYTVVSPAYFEAMNIPIKAGRSFSNTDTRDSLPVIIINESLARTFFGGEDPVGKQLWAGHSSALPGTAPRTVVGVVGDVLLIGLEETTQSMVYVPVPQQEASPNIWRNLYLVINAKHDPQDLVAAVRKRIGQIDSYLAVADVMTMEQRLDQSLWRLRLTAGLLGALSFAAVAIAMIGVFGITSYLVAQRTREIGVRVALGAQRRDIFRMIAGEGLILVLIGIGLGVVGSIALTRFLGSLLFGVTQTDPTTIATLSFILAALAMLAAYLPARRATKVDPLIALRYE